MEVTLRSPSRQTASAASTLAQIIRLTESALARRSLSTEEEPTWNSPETTQDNRVQMIWGGTSLHSWMERLLSLVFPFSGYVRLTVSGFRLKSFA